MASMMPCELIGREMQARGWTEHDLAAAMGRPVGMVRAILVGQCEITPDVAHQLAFAVGMSPATWLELERSYRSGGAAH